jgi:hypothetical protein
MSAFAGAVLAAAVTACTEDEEWWAADIAEAPCDLGMTPAVERETDQAVLSTEVIPTGYETVCDYRLTSGSWVRIDVFPARPEIVEALAEGPVWTPGSTGQTGYQGLHRYPGAAPTIYTRAVVDDVGANVSVTVDGTDAELIAAGEALALGAARAVTAHR